MKASVGRIVIVRTPSQFNSSYLHPGIITRVWGDAMVNVKVFPDCGAPYDETSVNLYATQEEGEASGSPTRFAHWPVIQPLSGGGPADR
jgi:hypothetical protein